jgi:hypothetical protein
MDNFGNESPLTTSFNCFFWCCGCTHTQKRDVNSNRPIIYWLNKLLYIENHQNNFLFKTQYSANSSIIILYYLRIDENDIDTHTHTAIAYETHTFKSTLVIIYACIWLCMLYIIQNVFGLKLIYISSLSFIAYSNIVGAPTISFQLISSSLDFVFRKSFKSMKRPKRLRLNFFFFFFEHHNNNSNNNYNNRSNNIGLSARVETLKDIRYAQPQTENLKSSRKWFMYKYVCIMYTFHRMHCTYILHKWACACVCVSVSVWIVWV